MKKIIVACLTVMFLVSCSSTDSPVVSQDVLVKKIIETDEDGVEITTNFTYNGNKIVRTVSDDGTKMEFTYTGELITQVKYFEGTTLFQTETYQYNTLGDMETYIILLNTQDYGAKEVYTYNNDGTIQYTRTLGDLVSQTESPSTGKIFFTNGEISKVETYGLGAVSVVNYTYDNKMNPFQNITGLNKITYADQVVAGFTHNVLTEVHPAWPSSNVTSVYQYNSNDYPISSDETSSLGVYNTLFFYE
jgi:uncharacterized protein YkuJ